MLENNKKVSKQSRLDSFFRKESKKVHQARVQLDCAMFDIAAKEKAVIMELRKAELIAAQELELLKRQEDALLIQQQTVVTTPDEHGKNTGVSITEIKNKIDGCYVANGVDHSGNRKKRPYVGRNEHPNWRVIGEYAELNHWKATIKEFPNDFQDCTPHAAEIRCSRWA